MHPYTALQAWSPCRPRRARRRTWRRRGVWLWVWAGQGREAYGREAAWDCCFRVHLPACSGLSCWPSFPACLWPSSHPCFSLPFFPLLRSACPLLLLRLSLYLFPAFSVRFSSPSLLVPTLSFSLSIFFLSVSSASLVALLLVSLPRPHAPCCVLGALSPSQLGGRLCPLPVLVPLLWGTLGGIGELGWAHLVHL